MTATASRFSGFPSFPSFPSFPAFPSFPTFDFFPPFNNPFDNDVVTVTTPSQTVSTRAGNDVVTVLANDATVDLGTDNDILISRGDGTVVFGGQGNDTLIGGDGAESLWGGAGNDTIRTGAGADYALGGRGDDLTDTGEGLGIHFGGAGRDTFFIGREIVGNGRQDTVIALDFTAGQDRLAIAPEILANIASVQGGRIDLVPVLAAFEAAGLSVAEVGQRLGLTDGGSDAFGEVAAFLARFPPNDQGQILVDGTTVTSTEGDVIIALGVTPDQLLAAVGG